VFAWLDRYQEHTPDLADAQLAVLCSRDSSHSIQRGNWRPLGRVIVWPAWKATSDRTAWNPPPGKR
jgi:hypothetical protein